MVEVQDVFAHCSYYWYVTKCTVSLMTPQLHEPHGLTQVLTHCFTYTVTAVIAISSLLTSTVVLAIPSHGMPITQQCKVIHEIIPCYHTIVGGKC